MTAGLQADQTSEAPICLWTETKAGHGLGKPTSIIVEQSLHEYGFLFDNLNIDTRKLGWFLGTIHTMVTDSILSTLEL